MRRHLLTLLLMCVCACAGAQDNRDYIIEIKPTKKFIHVDQLGVTDNTPIMDVLESMPELLGRPSLDGSLLANFSIQIDGRDVGQSRDVVLNQTMAATVDVIEISTSPTVSEQQNGTGGVINIKLKPIAKEGVSGIAMLKLSTEWDVQPYVTLDYKKDKFQLRSMVTMEYYQPTDYGYSRTKTDEKEIDVLDTTRSHYLQETAKLNLRYDPTKNDQVEWFVWESFARDKATSDIQYRELEQLADPTTFQELKYKDQQEKFMQDITAEAAMKYKHTYYTHRGAFESEIKYSYMPHGEEVKRMEENRTLYALGGNYYDTTYITRHSHEVMGKVCSKHSVIHSDIEDLELKYGADVKYQFGNSYTTSITSAYAQPIVQHDTTNPIGSLYVSPYLEMKYEHQKWFLQGGARYQYYQAPTGHSHQTVTGNISASCAIKQDHNLRLILARNIRKVNAAFGDFELLPYYNADLNYIYHWNDDQYGVITSVGCNYIYAQQQLEGYTGTACIYAQLIFKQRIFSMAFAGNGYIRNEYGTANNTKNCWYYNLSLVPVFNFKHQWTLSGKILYNSKMVTTNFTEGDCFLVNIRVAKTIKNWNINLELSDIFDYTTTNTLYSGGDTYTQLRDTYPRYVQVGCSYRF